MDPIKPFTTLIRSLRRAGNSADVQRTTPSGSSVAAAAGLSAVPAVQARLQAKLATLTTWDAKRARDFFVESTLLHEFGAELADDPAFFELVQRVSLHLAGESAVSERLDLLLRDVLAARGSR